MQDAPNAFAGVSFHCYAGSVDQQDSFQNAFPNKIRDFCNQLDRMLNPFAQEIALTECTGTIGSDYWQDIKVSVSYVWLVILNTDYP